MATTITTKEDSLDIEPFSAGVVVKKAEDKDILYPYTTRITPNQGVGSYVVEIQDTDGVLVPEGGVKPVTSSALKVKIGNAKIVASTKYTIEAKAAFAELENSFMVSFPGQIARAYNKTVLGLTPLPVGSFDPDFYTLANAPTIAIDTQVGTTAGDKALAAFDAVFAEVTAGEVNLIVLTSRALAAFAGYRNTTTGAPYFTIDRANGTINSIPYVTIRSTEFVMWAGDFTTLFQGLTVWDNGAEGTKLYTEFFGGVGLNNEEVWVQEVFAASGTSDRNAIVKVVLTDASAGLMDNVDEEDTI